MPDVSGTRGDFMPFHKSDSWEWMQGDFGNCSWGPCCVMNRLCSFSLFRRKMNIWVRVRVEHASFLPPNCVLHSFVVSSRVSPHQFQFFINVPRKRKRCKRWLMFNVPHLQGSFCYINSLQFYLHFGTIAVYTVDIMYVGHRWSVHPRSALFACLCFL